MSFCIGQAVTVHPSITAVGRYGGILMNSDMLRMKGRRMIIEGMNASINDYVIAENPFLWTQEMLIDWGEFSMPMPWVCSDCGEHMAASEGAYWVNGLRVCQNCFEESYFQCAICETAYNRDNGTYIEGTGVVCPTCLSRHFVICEHCGDFVNNDDDEFYHMDNGDDLCAGCFENLGSACEDCGYYFYSEQLRENRHGDHVCYRCYDSYSPIGDYHRTRAVKFFSLPTDTTNRYIGFELEVEEKCGDKVTAAENVLERLREDFIECKHDGSLNDGFEIVSQPATYHYHIDVDYAGAFRGLVSDGMRSHNPGTCGLHFHVSRVFFGEGETQYTNIAKMIVMLDNLWDDVVKFSRRNYHEINDWARKNPFPQKDTLKQESNSGSVSIETLDDIVDCNSGNRYQAINLTNRQTVEFRFMRGTLREQTFRASMEFVHLFTNYAVQHTMSECFTAGWHDIFHHATTNFKEYALSQGIGVPEYDHDDN